MGWLKKLLRREDDHDKWLAEHPGKQSTGGSPPPAVTAEDEQRTRGTMEGEMDAARSKREQG